MTDKVTDRVTKETSSKVGGQVGGQVIKDSKVSKPQIDTLNDTLENRIINLIKQNPSATQKTISEILKVSLVSVKRAMKKLSDSRIISRKNGKRNGYWTINKMT